LKIIERLEGSTGHEEQGPIHNKKTETTAVQWL